MIVLVEISNILTSKKIKETLQTTIHRTRITGNRIYPGWKSKGMWLLFFVKRHSNTEYRFTLCGSPHYKLRAIQLVILGK